MPNRQFAWQRQFFFHGRFFPWLFWFLTLVAWIFAIVFLVGTFAAADACIESLSQYDWPGNVRELANLVERLSILYPNGIVDVHDLPAKYRSPEVVSRVPPEVAVPAIEAGVAASELPSDGLDLKEHLQNIECDLIRQALEDSDWIVAHAAKRLQMGRTTLVEKMRKFDLSRDGVASSV